MWDYKSIIMSLLVLLGLQSNCVAATQGMLKFISVPTEAQPGQKISITVQAQPKAHLKIEAQGEGISQTLALKPIDADQSGKGTWTFEINKNYNADKLPIIVTASIDNAPDEKAITAVTVMSKASRVPGQLKFLSDVQKAMPGQDVTVSVLTEPGTKLKIEAQDAGIAQATALADKTADKSGKAAWTFKINDNYKADKMPVIVTGKFADGDKKLVSCIQINRM